MLIGSLDWLKSPGPPNGGEFPCHFLYTRKGVCIVSKKLSIFIDESGDFGLLKPHAPYYLVTMILHNQDIDISKNIKSLESHLHNLNFDYKAVHTGPIIRREEIYKTMLMEEIKRIFTHCLTLQEDWILTTSAPMLTKMSVMM